MEHRIKEISEKVDAPTSTIRHWQKEFAEFAKPAKTNGGQRRYSEEEKFASVDLCMAIARCVE